MTRFDAYEIAQRCGERELLIQTAEECSELAQACCKLLRVLDGKTPVPEKQARAALVEELADVHVTMQALEWRVLTINERVTMNITEDEKLDRWRRRIGAEAPQEAPLGAGAQNPYRRREEACRGGFGSSGDARTAQRGMVVRMSVVSNWEVYGLSDSVKASKYPMSTDTEKCTDEITASTKKLAGAALGSGHDNFLNGIIVQFDLTCSIKMWVEAERYHFLDFVSSQSTMHRITKLDPLEQCNRYVNYSTVCMLQLMIADYNADPTPEQYLRILYNVPVGFELTARMTTNYRQLKTIYHQRRNHRLPEWVDFCAWIETLPHFRELCLNGGSANEA